MNANMKSCLENILADERVNFRMTALLKIFAEHQPMSEETRGLIKDAIKLSERRQMLLNKVYCNLRSAPEIAAQNRRAAQSTLERRA